MPSFSPTGVPKSFTNPGSSGYGGYYNPKTPQFYNPKAPYNHKQPSNPQLPKVTPGDPTSPPKPITNRPYPNLKQPLNIPKLPTLPPLKPVLPPGGGLSAPVGGILPGGGVAGGLAAGAALLWAYNFYQLYKLWNLSHPESKPIEEPGQIPNVKYGIDYTVYTANQPPSTFEQSTDIYLIVWGEYKGHRYFDNPETESIELQFLCRGKVGAGSNPYTGSTGPSPELIWVFGNASRARDQLGNVTIRAVRRLDDNNQPIPEPPPQQQRQPQPQPLPQFQTQPQPREPLPQANNPEPPKLEPEPTPNFTPTPQKPPIRLQIPNNQPLTFTSPGNPPLVISQIPPKATPDQPKLPEQPTEIKFPRNTPQGQPQPVEIKPPGGQPLTFNTPGNTPITVNIPGFQPITVDPPNSSKPKGATPQLLFPGSFVPTPTTPTQPKPTPTPTDPATPEPGLPNVLIPATILATLTPLLQQILNNTSPASSAPMVSGAVCKTTQPGGCMSNLADDNTRKINQNTNDGIEKILNNTSNLANLALLPTINSKLGDQLPGGIGGKLSRFVNWAIVDRVTNLITMFAAVHNVMMLSNSVKETFLDVLDNLLNIGSNVAPNIFKAEDGSAIDARQYIGSALNNFFGGLFGVSEWTALKAQWKAYSTIYSSATQAYHNLREIHNDSQELLNMARNHVSELGNALVDEGVISEDNWEYKDANQKIKSKVLGRLERMGRGIEELDNKLEAIEQVTATLLNITNTAKEIKENIEAVDKAVGDANKAATLDREAKVEGLELPNFNLDDLF